MQESTYGSEIDHYRPVLKAWQIGAALLVLAAIAGIGIVLGGEFGSFMLAGLQTVPFVILALLAYSSGRRDLVWVATIGWLVVVVSSVALGAFGLGFAALQVAAGTLTASSALQTLLLLVLIGAGLIAGVATALPVVRRGLARIIPIDPDSFVHAVALTTVVTLTLVSLAPLVAVGAPPLLVMVESIGGSDVDITGGRGSEGLLRDLVYGLIWLAPGTLLAVGLGVRRNLRAALQRLGLVRPTVGQVLFGMLIAITLVLVVQVLSLGLDWLWQALGWPATDTEAFSDLLAFAMTPIGALVVGVTAGLGEELAVRGVLQPRLGIVLSNLFFTGLHAFQYHWDALLVVFFVGTIAGLVRRRFNTTTAAIVHGTYNFTLIMLAVLNVPNF